MDGSGVFEMAHPPALPAAEPLAVELEPLDTEQDGGFGAPKVFGYFADEHAVGVEPCQLFVHFGGPRLVFVGGLVPKEVGHFVIVLLVAAYFA